MSKNVIETTRSQRKIHIENSAMILVLIIWDARGAFRNEGKPRFHLIGITGFMLFTFWNHQSMIPMISMHQPMIESI